MTIKLFLETFKDCRLGSYVFSFQSSIAGKE